MDIEGAVAIVRDLGHDGVLGGAVGDTTGVALGLAQRVGVLAGLGVLDGAHRDVAASVVGAGCYDVVALNQLEGELTGLKVAAGQGLGRSDPVGDAGALGRHGVGVLKLNFLDVFGTLQLMRSYQLPLAVVGNGRHDGIDRLVVGDAAGIALDLAQRVGVLTDLGVFDGAERDVAVGIILNGLDELRVLTLDLAQLKVKLAFLKGTPGQGLGDLDLVGDAGLGGLGAVGVLELSLARGHPHVGAELALLVGRYRHGDFRDIPAVGDAVDRGPGMLLADLINVRAGFGVGNLAEADGCIALGHRRRRRLGHRGILLGRQLKFKRIRICPLATLEHLGQAKVGSRQRCRRGCKAKGNLAVVAQVRMHVRGRRNGGKVVPRGVKHVERGLGRVAAHVGLGGM